MQEYAYDQDRKRAEKQLNKSPTQTQMDDLRTGQAELREETDSELSTLDQQEKLSPSYFQSIIDSATPQGTSSAISAVHSHGSPQPAFVGAINVSGARNPTFVNSTLHFNFNVRGKSSVLHDKGRKGSPRKQLRERKTGKPELNAWCISRLCERISDEWQKLASILGFSELEITAFQHENQDNVRRCSSVLDTWLKRQGNNEEVRQILSKAITNIGRGDVAGGLFERPLLRVKISMTWKTKMDDASAKVSKVAKVLRFPFSQMDVEEKIGKILQESQANLYKVETGQMKFTICVESQDGLESLWHKYTTGELAKKLSETFITDEVTQEVTISESDYKQACIFFKDLESTKYEGNGQDASRKAMQPEQFGKDDFVKTTASANPPRQAAGQSDEATKASHMTADGEQGKRGITDLPPKKQIGDPNSEGTACRGDPAEHVADRCEEELKTLYKTRGSYAQMMKWVDDKTKMVTPKLLSEKRGKSLLTYEDIFRWKNQDGDPCGVVFLTGGDDKDKSFLLENITYDWAAGSSPVLQKFKLVAALKMVDLHQESDFADAIYDQLLSQHTDVKRTDLDSFIDANPNKVLLILDGFDELLTQYHDKTKCSSITKILHHTAARGIQVLVSTNPSNFHKLVDQSPAQEPYLHLTVSGITEQYIEEYVRTFYQEEPAQAANLLGRIRSSESLSDLAMNSMMLPLLCLISKHSALPETMTRLYDEALEYIFTRHSDMSHEQISQVVISLGKTALSGLVSQKKRFPFEEREFDKEVLDKALQVGLVTSQPVLKRQKSTDDSIKFICKIFQDCCAAKYCQSVYNKDKSAFLETFDRFDDPCVFEHFLRFCCGDNPQCATYVLRALCKYPHGQVHELALSCYFESQSNILLSRSFMESVITECMYVAWRSNDVQAAFMWFLEHLAKLEHVSRWERLARVLELTASRLNLSKYSDAFALSLTEMKQLSSLTLQSCTISGSNLNHFLSSVGKASNLINLDLTNSLSLDCVAENWAPGLKAVGQLQSLVLRCCHLKKQDILHIAAAAPCLKYLNLSSNSKLGGTADVWATQLQTLKNLQKLDLSGCNIDTHDMQYISVGELKKLSDLDLSQNTSLGSHVDTWVSGLKNMACLKTLNLQKCNVGSHEARHLLKAVSGMDILIHFSGNKVELRVRPMDNGAQLNIKQCFFTGEDTADIIQSCKRRGLVSLTFSAIRGLDGCADVWAPHLPSLAHLEELELQDCSLLGSDIEHLAAALSQMPSLKELSLEGNQSLGGSVETLAYSLKPKTFVQMFNLTGRSLTQKGMEQISKFKQSGSAFKFRVVELTSCRVPPYPSTSHDPKTLNSSLGIDKSSQTSHSLPSYPFTNCGPKTLKSSFGVVESGQSSLRVPPYRFPRHGPKTPKSSLGVVKWGQTSRSVQTYPSPCHGPKTLESSLGQVKCSQISRSVPPYPSPSHGLKALKSSVQVVQSSQRPSKVSQYPSPCHSPKTLNSRLRVIRSGHSSLRLPPCPSTSHGPRTPKSSLGVVKWGQTPRSVAPCPSPCHDPETPKSSLGVVESSQIRHQPHLAQVKSPTKLAQIKSTNQTKMKKSSKKQNKGRHYKDSLY